MVEESQNLIFWLFAKYLKYEPFLVHRYHQVGLWFIATENVFVNPNSIHKVIFELICVLFKQTLYSWSSPMIVDFMGDKANFSNILFKNGLIPNHCFTRTPTKWYSDRSTDNASSNILWQQCILRTFLKRCARS